MGAVQLFSIFMFAQGSWRCFGCFGSEPGRSRLGALFDGGLTARRTIGNWRLWTQLGERNLLQPNPVDFSRSFSPHARLKAHWPLPMVGGASYVRSLSGGRCCITIFLQVLRAGTFR